jgi:hypothetical protein
MKRFQSGSLAGWLTVAGLASIALAYCNIRMDEVNPDRSDKFLWLSVLLLGVVATLLGGIPWTHTPGKRRLKTAFLALVGCPIGAALGGFLGYEVADAGSGWQLEAVIWSLLIGSWAGAILFASLGVWWGITITRRLGRDANMPRKGNGAEVASK